MQWQADSIQAVMFTAPYGPQRDAASLWSDIFPGDGPDGYQRNPNAPNLQSSASGERAGYNVAIAAQVGQASVTLNPVFRQVPGLIPSPIEPPRISEVTSALEFVIECAARVFPSLNIIRIALISDLAKTVQTVATSEMLTAEIPQAAFPPGAIELSYQFNSQAALPSDRRIIMNRICSWSSGQVAFFGGNTPGIQFGNAMNMSNFLGLRIDVNTAPNQSLLDVNIRDALEALKYESFGIIHQQLGHFL